MYVAEAKTNCLVTGGVVSSGSTVSKSKYILLDGVVCSRDRRIFLRVTLYFCDSVGKPK